MPTLRINHTGSQVEAVFEDDGARHMEKRPFTFTLSPQEAEDIRWYLEDFRIYPVDPQPRIAKRVEQRMKEVGRELFRLVLGGSDVWEDARRNLGDTRIEVETELEDALVPWELLRDPVADLPLALAVPSFVRSHSRPALDPNPPSRANEKIRILLVICRLEGDHAPFRSVARHLIRSLEDGAREPFHLEVLRPPTFEQLAKTLRAAKAESKPFHVVHFDGHGLRGEVFFENPRLERNAEPVKAAELGKLLYETHVPLLTLNACRSAYSEPPEQPGEASDLHEQIRQFGSFSHAVMDYGSSGVVAWRYSVFVDTAARYMADLYCALASGLPLGEAATLARKQLSSGGRPIQDWTVPVIFEAAPVQLFPKVTDTFEIKLETSAAESSLPHAPGVGFIGRDETILKLDRAFDEQSVVLLHAYAGSGKTSAAAEFGRWYQQTGFSGPVLSLSFEQYKTLPQVLDELGRAFEGVLTKNGIQWATLDNSQRRNVALQVMRRYPLLWIWDNVEPIAGFPAGTPSAWSKLEQNDLLDFLHSARATKAKFLLTSRRDERSWLGDLPARVELPPMPFDERVQMTEALAKKLGRRLEDVEDWGRLLRLTQGNPLTLTVVVRQALRDGLKSREHIASFVGKLQAGESVFEDEASEGRTRSLAASLAYGFEHAFTEDERKQVALLHLFQGFVNVEVLRLMGESAFEWRLPQMKSLTVNTATALLDRAAEIGILTALGEGFYAIHPALPWFFRRFFEQYYSDAHVPATRAFVEAIGVLGEQYIRQTDVPATLFAEEANLLRARSLARSNGWWDAMIHCMQGLRKLYGHVGRTLDWSRLVEEIVPDFMNPLTQLPVSGRESNWGRVMEYRIQAARKARQWDEAEKLLNVDVNWNRNRASSVLAKPQETWEWPEKNAVRNLAASLQRLAGFQQDRGSANCVEGYQEALSLAERIQDSQLAAGCILDLGHAYKNLPGIQNLDLAEQMYRRSLELRIEEDWLGKGRCLGELGTIAYLRLINAKSMNATLALLHVHLWNAQDYFEQALAMFPASALPELATFHHKFGNLYVAMGQTDAALHHYSKSIHYKEAMHNRFEAGHTRRNAAMALGQAGRFATAREWAECAKRDYEACRNADHELAETVKLLQQIESDLRATSPLS